MDEWIEGRRKSIVTWYVWYGMGQCHRYVDAVNLLSPPGGVIYFERV